MVKVEIPSEDIIITTSELPIFVDCGENLASINCPECNSVIEIDWWSDVMSNLYNEVGFEDLSIKTPCCYKDTSLNNLIYDSSCGFSCIEFDILNPDHNIPEEFIDKFNNKFGINVRIIRAYV